MKNIIDTATDAGTFKTFVSAVKKAGLTETLSGKGPFTVFAPNDAAFAKLPKEKLDALFADPAKLADVLKYHVVSGKVMAKDVAAVKDATTLQGSTVAVTGAPDAKINESKIVKTDVECENGVIHVLDTVLMPK